MKENQEGNETQVKKSVYKKWWFWLIIVLVVLAVIGGIGGASSTNDGNDNNSSKNNNNDNNQTIIQQAYIGDTVTSSSVNFKVDRVENTKHYGSIYYGYDTEYNFILIYMEVENNSDSERVLDKSYFDLTKGDSKYEPHSGAYILDNGFWLSETIGAELKKTIVLVYEVPDNTTVSEYILSVKGSTFASKENIILKQK